MEQKKSGSKAVIIIIITIIVIVFGLICLCGAIGFAIFYPASAKYAEKARESSDRQAVNEVFVSGDVVLSDPTFASEVEKSDLFEIRINRYGEIKAYNASGEEVIWLEKEVGQLVGGDQLDFRSKKYRSMSSDMIFTYKKNDSGGFDKDEGEVYQMYQF